MVKQTKVKPKTLREWRIEFGLSQAQLADLVGGPTRRDIGKLETGQRSLGSNSGVQVLQALGLTTDQVIPGLPNGQNIDTSVWEDRASSSAPKQSLQWWRKNRCLSRSELASLALLSYDTISNIETENVPAVTLSTRRKLAQALQVRPDKLLLPGDKGPPVAEQALESLLRAELRGARRALKRYYDFVGHDPNIAHRALDDRDALLRDTQNELEGL